MFKKGSSGLHGCEEFFLWDEIAHMEKRSTASRTTVNLCKDERSVTKSTTKCVPERLGTRRGSKVRIRIRVRQLARGASSHPHSFSHQ